MLWLFGYEWWLKDIGYIDRWLTGHVSEHAVAVLNMMGYSASTTWESIWQAIQINQHPVVYIAHSCNGLVLYALFIGFIVSFSGKWKHKFLFILPGVVGIYLLNLFRVVCLSLIQVHFPVWLDISHKYVFTIIVYGFYYVALVAMGKPFF